MPSQSLCTLPCGRDTKLILPSTLCLNVVQKNVCDLCQWLSGFPTDSFIIMWYNCVDTGVHDDTLLSILFLIYTLKKAEKCI